MKKIILISVLLIITSCNYSSSETSNKLIKNSNGEVYIALIDKCFNEKSFDLTNGEIEKIDKLLTEKAIKEMESKFANIYYLDKKEKLKIELKEYKRQYCAYFNNKGEKEVYINCFCRTENDEWKTKQYAVLGGGKCYFSGIINLSTNETKDFMINAPQ